MSLFGTLLRIVELPFSTGLDVVKSPTRIVDNMCGDDVDLIPSTKNKLKQIEDEIDE